MSKNIRLILENPVLAFAILFVILMVLVVLWTIIRKASVKKRIRKMALGAAEMTPEEFFAMRNASMGRKHISTEEDFVGVYVLFNKSKQKYYVGQAKKVLSRINAHLTGHGNGDVYADYKYGDQFTIKAIALQNSGYRSLDELEKDTIAAYNAYNKGYNRTRGNRG